MLSLTQLFLAPYYFLLTPHIIWLHQDYKPYFCCLSKSLVPKVYLFFSPTHRLRCPPPCVVRPSVLTSLVPTGYIWNSTFLNPEDVDPLLLSKAYLDGIVDIEDDEGLQNISSILTTFIILFLVSLFYGATVTVIKVKSMGWEGGEGTDRHSLLICWLNFYLAFGRGFYTHAQDDLQNDFEFQNRRYN